MPKTKEYVAYVRAGLQLIPLHRYDDTDSEGRPRGKAPRDRGWTQRLYDSEAVIAESERTGINVGVRLPDTVVVIDNDLRNHPQDVDSLRSLCDAYGVSLKDAPHTITGSGGDHYWFRIPQGVRVRNALDGFPGVEFKSIGQQVVAAGSIHPDGDYYEVDDFAPPLADMPKLPAALLAAIRRDGAVDGSPAPAGELTPDDLATFLERLDPCDFRDHDTWLKLMMACHHATNGQGGEEFIEWSTADPSYASHEAIIRHRWNSLGRRDSNVRPITTRYLHQVAQAYSVPGPNSQPEDEFDEPDTVVDLSSTEIALNKAGRPINSYSNCLVVLRKAQPRLGLSYNDFTQAPVLSTRELPWSVDIGRDLTDDMFRMIRDFILEQYSFEVSKDHLIEASLSLARQKPFHPVRQYLDALEWDGKPRLESFLATYFGADNSEYTQAVGLKTLLGAVRRVRRPGCKFDTVLVLEGEQGTGKSSGIRMLCPEEAWFSDSALGHVDNKDAALLLQGCWIHEIGEMAVLTKSEAESLKAFVSRQTDNIRRPYERRPVKLPRQCIFIGTTNQGGYLQDQTGNRRFWPVRTSQIDTAALERDRDQIWAEAALRERNGESLELPQHLWVQATREQADRLVEDPWAAILRDYVDNADDPDGNPPRDKFSSNELLTVALNLPAGNQEQRTSKRLRSVMEQSLNWKYVRGIRDGSSTYAGYIRPPRG